MNQICEVANDVESQASFVVGTTSGWSSTGLGRVAESIWRQATDHKRTPPIDLTPSARSQWMAAWQQVLEVVEKTIAAHKKALAHTHPKYRLEAQWLLDLAIHQLAETRARQGIQTKTAEVAT